MVWFRECPNSASQFPKASSAIPRTTLLSYSPSVTVVGEPTEPVASSGTGASPAAPPVAAASETGLVAAIKRLARLIHAMLTDPFPP